MIFVTVGASPIPFDRLVAAVDTLETDDLVVQRGSSRIVPHRGTCVDFMDFEAIEAHLAAADVVIAHAGAGSIMAALAAGRVPIVVPRLQRLGEAVDDHQLEFAQRLDARELVRFVEDVARLPAAVAVPAPPTARPGLGGDGRLAAEIREFVERRVGAAETAGRP